MFPFIFFICLPLLLVGLCDFLHYLRLLLLRPKREPKKTLLVKICDENELIGIASIYEKMRWHGKYFADKVICVHSEDIDDKLLFDYREKGILFLKEDKENRGIFEIGESYAENGASWYSRENYISKP